LNDKKISEHEIALSLSLPLPPCHIRSVKRRANLVINRVKLGEDDSVDEVRVVIGGVVGQRRIELDQLLK
jgi:hypothetical protein